MNQFSRKDLSIVLVENKNDLIAKGKGKSLIPKLEQLAIAIPYQKIFGISTYDKQSIDQLKSILFDQVNQLAVQGDVIVSNARHFEALQNALKAVLNVQNGMDEELSGDLLSVDINEALHYLGEISGTITNDELLGNIFSKFCIGK